MKLRPLPLIVLLSLASLSTLALADPSGRVGRISSTEGAVTFRNTASGDAQQASVNWPVTSDNELITDSNARAEFRVGSAAVRLDGNSDLEVQQLDDNHFRLRLNRGSAEIRIRNPELARDFSLDTPQGHILLSEPSSVRIDARYDTPLTALTVQSGTASFDGGNARFALPAGRHAEIADGDLRVLQSSSAYGTDSFDSWTASLDRQDDRSQSVRYLSAETTGYEELDNHGAWRVTSAYGPVWTPSAIPVDWAPYRDGRWTWISPWGWTWVDNASWGYAPSHYGRWVFYDQRWSWTPGAIIAQPVWAPALVGWVGGSSWQVGFSSGPAAAIGWFPLAPRDVYVPGYQVSPRYVQQVNNIYIVNGNVHVQNNYYNNGSSQNYQNQYVQNAVTVMPQNQFSVSKTVLVTPTTLGSRQMAILHAAPLSATVPPISAPRAVTNPTAPSYQQRVAPLGGPIMQVERSHASNPPPLTQLPAATRLPEQYRPARNAMMAPATAHFESGPVPQRVIPAAVLSRSPGSQSEPMSLPSTSNRQRRPAEFERQIEQAPRNEPRQPMPQHAVMVVVPAPQVHAMAEARPAQQQQSPQPMRSQSSPDPRHSVEGRQAHQNYTEREGFGRPHSPGETR